MSRDVSSAGLMAPLSRKLTDEEIYNWIELLYDQGSSIRINYEGTLAYSDEGGSDYGINFGLINIYSNEAFNDLAQFDITVDLDKARPYTCRWYNGVDSDMDMMTFNEFLKMTGQT